MTLNRPLSLLAAPLMLALAMMAAPAWAQADKVVPATGAASAAPTRLQVQMEYKEFLKTHRWDEASNYWVLKSGVEPPTGVTSRAKVKADRDEFLRNNRWDEPSNSYLPRTPVPATLSGLTRAQVRADTARFMRVHRWDEESGTWVPSMPAKRK